MGNNKNVILTEVVGAETLEGYNISPIPVPHSASPETSETLDKENSNDKNN